MEFCLQRKWREGGVGTRASVLHKPPQNLWFGMTVSSPSVLWADWPHLGLRGSGVDTASGELGLRSSEGWPGLPLPAAPSHRARHLPKPASCHMSSSRALRVWDSCTSVVTGESHYLHGGGPPGGYKWRLPGKVGAAEVPVSLLPFIGQSTNGTHRSRATDSTF